LSAGMLSIVRKVSRRLGRVVPFNSFVIPEWIVGEKSRLHAISKGAHFYGKL
jgi:hypothetical protein